MTTPRAPHRPRKSRSHPRKPSTNAAPVGVIIVDHGSRRPEANDMLLEVVRRYAARSRFKIVEPAHMELAEPSIGAAFDRCVARGARRIVVMPYFLSPGKHWDQDIPRLSAAAVLRHPGVAFMVTAPLGLHPMIAQVIEARIEYCLRHAGGKAPACEVCAAMERCVMRVPEGAARRDKKEALRG